MSASPPKEEEEEDDSMLQQREGSEEVEVEEPVGKSLTELGNDEDEEEQEEEEEDDDGPSNDQEGEQVGEGDSDDEQDDEDEEDEEDDRPKKKKRRKPRAPGNQFLDIEADVDDEEEDDEEEGEEGFVPLDNFIENRPDRAQQQARGLEGEIQPLDDDAGDYADGDASHRLLDRRLNKAKDREAEELAASFVSRYGKSRYDTEGSEEWAPKALLMPGVNDASIWGLKCKTGRERELVLSLSRKAAALAASDNAQPLQIISAFQRDSIKGYIYIEARSESHVRNAIVGLIGIYLGTPGGVFLVDIEEMPDLLRTKQKKIEVLPGGWVRIKRGKYAGDLAQIVDLTENGEDVALKFIPRIDLTPKDKSLQTGSDGKKRKKGAGAPLAFRPPQRMFNPEEIAKIYGNKEVQKRGSGVLTFKGDTYKDGYLEKDVKLNALIIENVSPSLDELTHFLGESGSKGVGVDGGPGFDLTRMAEVARTAAKSILQPGDHVEVFEGDQRGIYGSIDSIQNDVVIITPHTELDLVGTKIEVQARSVRKRFRAGDHVKVMNGSNQDETGLVVNVKDDVVTFMSDLTMNEVTVFSKDVREAAEVGSGVNIIGKYELHDLVQLDPQTTGVIFAIERDSFRILDQAGTVRLLKPSQISNKLEARGAVATDANGLTIITGDEMAEEDKSGGIPRKGRVIHTYRSLWAFLHNREYAVNGGVFVVYTRSLTPTAKSKATFKAATGLNPDRFSQAAPLAPVVGARPDGRIHRNVLITRGAYKGYSAVIKDVSAAGVARVELYTNSKVITLPVIHLKEQKADGTTIELLERTPFIRSNDNGGGGNGFGGNRRPDFNRDGSSASTSSNSSALGSRPSYPAPGAAIGGRTPFPSAGGRTPFGFSGGRTPAPGLAFSSGRTPAPAVGGSGSFDNSGRTPAYNGGTQSGLGNASSRTPAYPSSASSTSDAWNPSSATPRHTPSSSSSDPWSVNSRTPFHPSLSQNDTPTDGGRTPDPRAGARTPLYGAKSSYTGRSGEDRGEGGSNLNTRSSRFNLQSAPTPAANDYQQEWSDNSAPTPAATAPTPHDYNRSQAKTPYEASTPYGQGAPTPGAHGAPTPGVFAAPTPGASYGGAPTPSASYGGAPTPGASYGGAPTPAAYGGAPTPGASYSGAPTPGAGGYYGAPTPHGAPTPGAYGAPTPSGYGPTPGAYGAIATPGGGGGGGGYPSQTPGAYQGAATAAAAPMEYVQRVNMAMALPKDWARTGLRVLFGKSGHEGGKYDDMNGVIFEGGNNGLWNIALSNNSQAKDVPISILTPVHPTKAGEQVIILAGESRGSKATTQSRDGSEWMVQIDGGSIAIIAQTALGVTL